MKCAEETTYLGASVTKIVDLKNKIRKRISAAMAVLKKLDIFWLRANCNKKWNLLVYSSVIVSKLLYGLESLSLLNTFQLKGFCNAIQHSYSAKIRMNMYTVGPMRS